MNKSIVRVWVLIFFYISKCNRIVFDLYANVCTRALTRTQRKDAALSRKLQLIKNRNSATSQNIIFYALLLPISVLPSFLSLCCFLLIQQMHLSRILQTILVHNQFVYALSAALCNIVRDCVDTVHIAMAFCIENHEQF